MIGESVFNNLETKPGMKEHNKRGLISKKQQRKGVKTVNKGHAKV